MNAITKKILAVGVILTTFNNVHTSWNPANLGNHHYGAQTGYRDSDSLQQQFQDDLAIMALNNKAKTIALTSAFTLIATYLYDAAFTTENDLVEAQFPYAHQWIQTIIAKYPDAQFDEAWFVALNKEHIPLRQFKTLEQQEKHIADWKKSLTAPQAPQVQHGNVKYAYYMLEKINDIFEKVVNGDTISTEEESFLQKQEWLLLQSAKALSTDSFAKKMAALCLGAIAVDQLFEDQSYRYVSGISLLMTYLLYLRYDNIQNEVYGNTLADDTALQGGLAFLEEDEQNFVTNFANKYNEYESNTLSDNFATDALKPRSKAAQAVYAAIYNIKKYGSKAFFTCMKPVKFLCSQDFAQKGFNLVFNPVHQSKEERIQQIQDRISKTA